MVAEGQGLRRGGEVARLLDARRDSQAEEQVIPVSPKWVGGSGPFSDASLQRAMDRAIYVLSTEHPDHTVAIVAHADNDEGASLSAIVKVGDEWKLEGSVVKGFDQPFKWGAQVIWSR